MSIECAAPGRRLSQADWVEIRRNIRKQQREIAEAERQIPSIASAVQSKVEEIFRPVNLSKKVSSRREGAYFVVKQVDDEERIATAWVNGSKCAELSIFKYSVLDCPDVINARVYTLYGNRSIINACPFELNFSPAWKDLIFGTRHESRLFGHFYKIDGTRILIEDPITLTLFARDLGIKV